MNSFIYSNIRIVCLVQGLEFSNLKGSRLHLGDHAKFPLEVLDFKQIWNEQWSIRKDQKYQVS